MMIDTVMTPTTPLRNRFPGQPILSEASSPFSTNVIPSSAYPSSRSTTPDSVYSDVTHPTETPRRNGWTPIRGGCDGTLNGNGNGNAGEMMRVGDTPRIRTKDRKPRTKPTYQPGFAAYPLTFPSHTDIYTFSTDPNRITDLLDREHLRVAALPPAIFQSINTSSFHLDDAQIQRIQHLTAKTKAILEARVPDPRWCAFPLDDPDSYARSLKQYTDKYLVKLERESRSSRDSRSRGRVRVREPVRRFGAEEWKTWEKLVAWKGRLPLHMGEYDPWIVEWEVEEAKRREGRTSFGRVVVGAGAAVEGRKGKRKQDDLTVMVPRNPESITGVKIEQQAPTSPIMQALSTKRQRTEPPIETEQQDSEQSIPRGQPKKQRTEPPTAEHAPDLSVHPIRSQPAKKARTERIAEMRARADYTTTPTITPTSAESAAFVQVVERSRSGIASTGTGIGKEKRKASKRGEGRGLGFTVSKSSITSSCSSPDPFEGKLEATGVVRLEALRSDGAVDEMDGMVVRVSTPTSSQGFVTARSTAAPVESTTEQASVPELVANDAASTAFTAEYWTEMKRLRAANIARRRSGVAVVSDEESSGLPSAAIAGAEAEMEAVQGEVGCGAAPDDEMEGVEDAEKYPSLSFPKDLPTSTPKLDRTAHPNADETTIMHSSPGRPVWQCESLPQDPPVKSRTEEPMQATQRSEPEPPVVPQGAGSMSDLTGLMDDLTSSRRRARSTAANANAKRSGWNVTSSPAGEPGSMGMGDSQQIRRMGQGVMAMTAELLGQELVE